MVCGVETSRHSSGRLTIGTLHDTFGHPAQQAWDDSCVDDQGNCQLPMIGVAPAQRLDNCLGRAAGVVVNEYQQEGPTNVIRGTKYAAGGDSLEAECWSRLTGREWLSHAAIVV